jgi:aminocarboxymuconate-semialdehyde decarboxylase
MQDPKLAVQELDRAAKLPGMHAVWMGEDINDKSLHDKSFWPVYERIEALGLPICLHTVFAHGEKELGDFFLLTLMGNPQEGGVAAAKLVFGGVLDAFPGLVFSLPHAGGTFPWLIGRLDEGYRAGIPVLQHVKQPPSAYLRRFYYDSLIFSPQRMQMLVEIVGPDRIVIGTDYDQMLSYKQPVNFIETVPGLSTREREMILGGNAARFLKL